MTLQHFRKIRKILDATEGFNVVHENGAYVLNTEASPRSSEQYVQPVISNNKLQRALSQASQEHEKKRTLETEEQKKDLDQPDKRSAKRLATPFEPRRQEWTEHEVTHCPNRACREICVSAKSLDVDNTGDRNSTTRTSVTEFDYTLGTDRPGDPERRVVIVVMTDSVNKSCPSSVARREGAQDEYVFEVMLHNLSTPS